MSTAVLISKWLLKSDSILVDCSEGDTGSLSSGRLLEHTWKEKLFQLRLSGGGSCVKSRDSMLAHLLCCLCLFAAHFLVLGEAFSRTVEWGS